MIAPLGLLLPCIQQLAICGQARRLSDRAVSPPLARQITKVQGFRPVVTEEPLMLQTLKNAMKASP